jgi:hypothetical protein
MNPYYSPEKLGLEMISFEEDGLSYEFNTLCFWATSDGSVYSAQDSGCSCPTPFEDYDKEELKDVLMGMEKVESKKHALQIFKAWNDKGDNLLRTSDGKDNLEEWFKKHFKKNK